MELLAGRQWLSSQMDSSIFKETSKITVIENGKCNRCGSAVKSKLPNGKLYCRKCIGIGRAVEGDYLVRNQEHISFPKLKNGGLTWHGELTTLQKQKKQ